MTSTLNEPLIIDQPGLYDIPESVYHGDPVPGGSLSSTGARKLLPPNCPAKYRWERDNPPAGKREFDLGKTAHTDLLGTGAEIVVVKANDWRTKVAQQQRTDAYATGNVPILEREYEQVQAMTSAVRRHPIAGALFDPSVGQAERSAFWVDRATDVRCRARFDFLRDQAPGRLLVGDLKTCASADWEHLQRAIHNNGYHQQAAFYLDGIKALNLADNPAFVFVFVEKDPPHLIRVVQLDPAAERIGRSLNREALGIYAECHRTDQWPGYSDAIDVISLPAWVENRHTKEIW
jgi:hypothetical protein